MKNHPAFHFGAFCQTFLDPSLGIRDLFFHLITPRKFTTCIIPQNISATRFIEPIACDAGMVVRRGLPATGSGIITKSRQLFHQFTEY